MTEYEVIGTRAYRGHQPGETFVARLEPGPERRAIVRGDIRVLTTLVPALPDNHKLPPGWADGRNATEAPAGVSSMEGRR